MAQQQRSNRPQGLEFTVLLQLSDPFKVGDEWFVTAMVSVKHRSGRTPDPSLNEVVDFYRNGNAESSSVPLDRNGNAATTIRLDAVRMNYIQAHFVGTGFSSQIETAFVKPEPEEKKSAKKLLPPRVTKRRVSKTWMMSIWEFNVLVFNEDMDPVENVAVIVSAETVDGPELTNEDGFTSFRVRVVSTEGKKGFRISLLGPGQPCVSAQAYY